jgi:uncharacterized protein (DUF2236 family)
MADPGMGDVVREGGLLLGGGRAILLQVAHPAIGRGVAEHSDFARRQLDRLRATMSYVYTITFGTPAERARIAREVTEIHRTVHGPGYDALDPELQLWVAATLYDTAVLLYQRWFGRLSDSASERIYQNYRILGTALQMPAELWPANRVVFRQYWHFMIDTMVVAEHARRVCRDLLHPQQIPLRASAPLNRLITAGLLPARVRRAYQLPWDAGRQRRFDWAMGAIGAVYPRLPLPVREFPRWYYLGGGHAAPEAPVN